MQWLNPMNDPLIVYARTYVEARIDRLRQDPDKSRGASAIEWAIITGILALIAISVGWIIFRRVKSAANKINVDNGPGGG
jgi:Flp pilus assembly pilin Flp